MSILGSGLSTFGLSVWIFEKTNSATSFAMTFLMNMLPGIFFGPLAGSLADRKNRKFIIIITDTMDALLKVLLVVLLVTNRMELWMIYPISFISSTLGSLQGPSFNASLPEIVPKKDLGRANGLMQLIGGIQGIIAPIFSGALYPTIGLSGLLIVDIVTFIIAMITIIFQKIPQPKIEDSKVNASNIIKDFKYAIEYLKKKVGFISLIMSFAILNFLANICVVLIGPLVMSNYESSYYGFVNSMSGMAMFLGGVIAGIFSLSKGRVKKIYLALILSGIGLIIVGISPTWYIIGIGYFIFMLPVPFANGNLGTIMQLKIEGNVLGRVGALVNSLLKIVSPIAIISAGFLSDKVFNPLLVERGKLSNTFIASILGVGENRGTAIMFILSGIFLILFCVLMTLNKDVINLEENNLDVNLS